MTGNDRQRTEVDEVGFLTLIDQKWS